MRCRYPIGYQGGAIDIRDIPEVTECFRLGALDRRAVFWMRGRYSRYVGRLGRVAKGRDRFPLSFRLFAISTPSIPEVRARFRRGSERTRSIPQKCSGYRDRYRRYPRMFRLGCEGGRSIPQKLMERRDRYRRYPRTLRFPRRGCEVATPISAMLPGWRDGYPRYYRRLRMASAGFRTWAIDSPESPQLARSLSPISQNVATRLRRRAIATS